MLLGFSSHPPKPTTPGWLGVAANIALTQNNKTYANILIKVTFLEYFFHNKARISGQKLGVVCLHIVIFYLGIGDGDGRDLIVQFVIRGDVVYEAKFGTDTNCTVRLIVLFVYIIVNNCCLCAYYEFI